MALALHILLGSFNIYAAGLCIRTSRLTRLLQQIGLTIFLFSLTAINLACAIVQFSYIW